MEQAVARLIKFEIKNWDECINKVHELRAQHADQWLWFRGHADSEWLLETTLERRTKRPYSFREYYALAYQVKGEIESVTGSRWDTPDFQKEIIEWASRWDVDDGLKAVEYLSHLRHHGFPSPLLDWTRSPYIAAFFAFAPPPRAKDGSIALYVYLEKPQRIKLEVLNAPTIRTIHYDRRTHARHFRQQSRYTICGKFEGGQGWKFAPHEDAFTYTSESWDKLWKIIVPATEREKVLTQLDEFNLNAFSLFGSDESLMETLAIRGIDFFEPVTPVADAPMGLAP
jgi:hypothetical protein